METLNTFRVKLNIKASGKNMESIIVPSEPKIPSIDGWVARDLGGYLGLYDELPWRFGDRWKTDEGVREIDGNYFSDLKWTDEPLHVTLKIVEYEEIPRGNTEINERVDKL